MHESTVKPSKTPKTIDHSDLVHSPDVAAAAMPMWAPPLAWAKAVTLPIGSH
jgi:hypothetical protein